MSTKKSYIYHTDPGHGWLEVSRSELEKLNLSDEITSFSYAKGLKVFLEEDCDMGLFLEALQKAGIEAQLTEIHLDDTPIRGYEPYYPLK